jgi:hypothetical protein
MIRLLAFGCENAALQSRSGSLEAAGIQVVCAEKEEEARTLLLRTRRFDVVTIGPAVPLHERNRIALLAKSGHKAAIIFLYRGSVFHAEIADALLSADIAPEDLILTIQRVASSNGDSRLSRSAG